MNGQISTGNAPAAVGPYSQARKVGNLLFISGQPPIDPATGEFSSKMRSLKRMRLHKRPRPILPDLQNDSAADGSWYLR